MRRVPVSFIIASVVCVPMVVTLVLYLVALLCTPLLGLTQVFDPVLEFICIPVFFAYYLLPSIFGVFYLGAAQVSLFAAWDKIPFRSRLSIVLGCYNLVILLCGGYDIWWFATAQKFDYL